MELDEQILNDVTSLRASGWEASAMQPFDGASLHATVSLSLQKSTKK